MPVKRVIAAAFVAILLAALFLLTPPKLEGHASTPELPDDLDAYLLQKEQSSTYPIIENTDKRIRWQVPGERSAYAIVYLHGFSATRREITPTMELVADALDANLYETRLTGHGRATGALVDVRAESWLDDAAEALAVGQRIGDKIILVGTSTGGTLAAAMLDHPLMASVSDVVFLSPNFKLRDAASRMLTMPAGPQLANTLIGPMRSFDTQNDMHALYWSTEYPTAALVEMMRLVNFANANIPDSTNARLLLIVSPNDKVISPGAAIDFLDGIDAPTKQLIEVNDSDDTYSHVLSGAILSPSTTERVAADIVSFIEASLPGRPEQADRPDAQQ